MPRRPAGSGLSIFLVSLAAALGLIPLVAFTVAQPWHVQGRSMEPALADGSVLLVDAVGPRVSGYGRGDIVIVPLPANVDYPHPILVKRIVALAGDHVQVANGVVRINGVVDKEPYLPPGTLTGIGGRQIDLVVPPGTVYVMGDHRANTYDSTSFGPVQAASIVGRAWFAVAPGGAVELAGAAAGSQ